MAAKKKAVAKAPHGTGVCALGFKLIREGKINEEVLVAIQKKFPESKLKLGGVGWLRNKLRQDGEKISTNIELKAARHLAGLKKKNKIVLDPAA